MRFPILLLIQHAILVVVAYDQTKNTSLLDLPNTNFDGLDEDFLKLTIQSAKLSSAIMRPNGTIEYPEAAVFLDEPDEAWLVKIENICFVAFRGTLESSPEDISQNTDLAIADDVCYNGECCSARQGYRDAVLRPLYREDLDASVRACVNSCSGGEAEEDCGLVLTGFSQGGSAAMIAAVTMRDMDPTTITFGQPTTMATPCAPLDTSKYFRFINTIVNRDVLRLKYDAAPFVEKITRVQHTGQALVLGANVGGVAGYQGRDAPDIGFLSWAPNFLQVHNIESYVDRLEALLTKGIFPISVKGFDSGSPCTIDSECRSPDTCLRGHCGTSFLRPLSKFRGRGGV